MGAGRRYKLDVKNRFLLVLVYYRLYITYTLTGFLFDLDQSNVCRDIQKIEGLISCLPIPQKTIRNNQKTKDQRRGRRVLSRHYGFYGPYRTRDT
ncbi:MAG: transposase family protein [Candidatus Nitrosocosmicus sp.]|nr:transposase family protein [Candidatus Nitrosocosmicus sp.]MDN5867640.1 transposase family protein [Candidatus Nitrosocosmicus sp.]